MWAWAVGFATTLGVAWILWELQRLPAIRTKVREAAPEIDCRITSTGGPTTLHLSVHNQGNARAYDLSLTVPTVGVVWEQAQVDPGPLFHPAPMHISGDAAILATQMADLVANLTFEDRFQLQHRLPITLEQRVRPGDGRFNIHSQPGQVIRPKLTTSVLWKLRKKV